MSDGKIPNQESGFLDTAHHSPAVQPQKSHLTTLYLILPASRMGSLDHVSAKVPYSLKRGLGLSCNVAPQPPCVRQQCTPGSAGQLTDWHPWSAIFQHQAINNFGPVLKTPIFSQISSFAGQGCPITHTPRQTGGTICPPALPLPCQTPPGDLLPAHTTSRTAHRG